MSKEIQLIKIFTKLWDKRTINWTNYDEIQNVCVCERKWVVLKNKENYNLHELSIILIASLHQGQVVQFMQRRRQAKAVQMWSEHGAGATWVCL